MIDRTTKVLLALIAIGLWMNAAAPLLRPAKAELGDWAFRDALSNLAHSVDTLAQKVGCLANKNELSSSC
jgi:hypothetical protein